MRAGGGADLQLQAEIETRLHRESRMAAQSSKRPHSSRAGQLQRTGLQRDPAQRPLILSERATDRQDWARRVLKRGYTESGHANRRGDRAVDEAFAAFADYTRGEASTQTCRCYARLVRGFRSPLEYPQETLKPN